MSSIIRLHYQDNYKIVDLQKTYTEFRKLCGKEFNYQYDSEGVKLFFITYDEDSKIPISEENYNQYTIKDLLEILIESDFPKKEVDMEEEIENVIQYSSKLVEVEKEKKEKTIIDHTCSFEISIMNNGKEPWPLPLCLSPLKESTIYCHDYSISKKVYPNELITLKITLIENKSKPPGHYVLQMQLKKSKFYFGNIFRFYFNKI